MSSAPLATLYHVHDPMCSWCWGYRQTWDQLCGALPETVSVVNVVGGLAPDTNEPMPLDMQNTIAGYWLEVAEQTGAQFNLDFWERCQPRRSTYPACRAILAAGHQQAEQPMIDAIQQAYYLRAMNPSDNTTLITLAEELGLDGARFARDISSPEIQNELESNFAIRRRIGVYSFPSLVLETGRVLTPIEVDYKSHLASLDRIEAVLLGEKNPS